MSNSTWKYNGVTISLGNTKMGGIPSVSLHPDHACEHKAPCYKTKKCYALQLMRVRPGYAKSLLGNSEVCRYDPLGYWQAIQIFLSEKTRQIAQGSSGTLFRFHVAGDAPDAKYAKSMCTIASLHPTIKFMAFTKRPESWFRNMPFNLQIIYSQWKGWKESNDGGIRAWMYDKKDPDDRIPKDALPCPGKCDQCGVCWRLQPGDNVVFNKH